MIHIIGTAHVSQDSVEEVERSIREKRPDVVAVELCQARHDGLLDQRDIPIVDLIKSGNSLLFVVNMLLSFFQRRIGDEMGIKPGREMLVAMDAANDVGARIALIDRDIKVTLNRAIGGMGFWEKLRLAKELLFGLITSGDEVDIEELKKDENLVDVLKGFRDVAPSLFNSLVAERDAYMASKLIELSKENDSIVAVVGAGHRRGIEEYIEHPDTLPPIADLVTTKKGRFLPLLKYGIPGFIIASFILAFSKGISIEGSLLLWIAYNAIPTGIGVIIARGHPLSILVGMLASPLTSLNPLLAAGWFAGVTEAKVRGTTVGEVKEMFKISGYRELYRNGAFRVLLVTALANLGSTIGTFTFIPKVLVPMLRGVL